ncbi:MAG: MATE family efflux transporter, partial [Lachnospiraceae bacterium]|nr:MATE family efflux transporter [Lachnospiraceae bacterium]
MSNIKKTKTLDMTEGNIAKLLITFAIPLLLGNIFQYLYNTVDSLVVGNFVGKEALAAVGSTTYIINTLVMFFGGISVGASVIISRYFGAHDDETLHRAIETTMALTFIGSVLCTVAGIALSPLLLRFMDTPEDVLPSSSVYLRIYFGGITGLMVYNMGSGILRAVGDTKRPLYFLIFSSIMNIILDLLFVVVFGLGIAGVAYATVLAQMISAVLVLILLTKSKEKYRLVWKDLHVDMQLTKEILSVGFPVGLQQAVTSFSNVYVQSYINSFGSAGMAGWSSFTKIDS